MSEKKRGLFAAMRDGITEITSEVKQVSADIKAGYSTPVPPADAAVSEKVDYLETARVYIGHNRRDVTLIDGDLDMADALALADDGEEAAGSDYAQLGITTPLVALLRASLGTNPGLVDDVVEPILRRRRHLGYGKSFRESLHDA